MSITQGLRSHSYLHSDKCYSSLDWEKLTRKFAQFLQCANWFKVEAVHVLLACIGVAMLYFTLSCCCSHYLYADIPYFGCYRDLVWSQLEVLQISRFEKMAQSVKSSWFLLVVGFFGPKIKSDIRWGEE